MVLAIRKGNPKHITDWSDLIKPGVSVIVPNPITSGGARWDIMAAYGTISNKGADKTAGVDYLQKLFKNVAVQDDSARKALQTFTNGKGDVLISYENDAIFAQQNGQAIDIVKPSGTILIENPIAVTTETKHPKQAQAFVDFLYTQAGAGDLRRQRLPAGRLGRDQQQGHVHHPVRACSPSRTSVAGPT